MASPAGNLPPTKPWERVPSSTSGPSPFRPPSTGSTSAVVEASGTAKPGEVVATGTTIANTNPATGPVQPRPWEQNYGSTYGGYGNGMYNSAYGSGMNAGYGSLYGGGLYGNGMYRGGGYGQYGNSMYGGGMYGNGFGGATYGMSMPGPHGNQDPNNPFGGGPPSPPGFWMSFLRVMGGIVNFFGRIAMLIDQNTQAFHMFMSALLQLFDRSGVLYGELARFVFRILGMRTKGRKPQGDGPGTSQVVPPFVEGPKAAAPATGAWDNVWGEDGGKMN